MLKYNIKLSTPNSNETVELSDFYLDKDLKYISGVTESDITFNDSLSLKSNYSPKSYKMSADSIIKCKRYGYITRVKKCKIGLYNYYQAKELTSEQNSVTPIKYIVLNGVTYFQNIYNKDKTAFNIQGKNYSVSNTAIEVNVNEKIYIDNLTASIDGVDYTLMKNDNFYLIDSLGNVFSEAINTENVKEIGKDVSKIRINKPINTEITVYDAFLSGFNAFIIYNGKTVYLEDLIDSSGNIVGYGVIINGKQYNFDSMFYIETDDDGEKNEYIVRKKDNVLPEVNYHRMTIEDEEFDVSFEFAKTQQGPYLCLCSNDSIAPNSIIYAKSSSNYSKCDVITNIDGTRYIVYNCNKYNVSEGLFDMITIGENEYKLTYITSEDNVIYTSIAFVEYNGEKIYFAVNQVENGKPSWVVKVNYDGVGLSKSNTIYEDSSGNTVYGLKFYQITRYDGVKIGDDEYRISTFNISGMDGECVYINKPSIYKLEVKQIIGGNNFLCEASIPSDGFFKDELEYYSNSVISSIATSYKSLVYEVESNIFGPTRLWVEDVAKYVLLSKTSKSNIELSGIYENLEIVKSNDFMNIPLSLSNTTDISLQKEDLLNNAYYWDNSGLKINQIVDMEKDVYIPTTYSGDTEVKSLKFNLHFRTRDLSTWKINTSYGQDTFINESSNWFITDYWPYSEYISKNGGNFNRLKALPDLLGFLYFTTEDVMAERDKLKRSFIRISFYDSYNPTKQNLIGTSTIFTDVDKYNKLLTEDYSKTGFVFKRAYQKYKDSTDNPYTLKPTEFGEAFLKDGFAYEDTNLKISDIPRLDCGIEVFGRNKSASSCEGFYAYILKNFSTRTETKKIYMKVDYYHAGLGVKIPFILPTDSKGGAITTWDNATLSTFKEGYDLDGIYKRLYIPLDVKYNSNLKRYTYNISSSHSSAVEKDGSLNFDLFEIKVKE